MSNGATTFQLDTTLPADREPFTKCFRSDKFVKSEDFRKFLDDYKDKYSSYDVINVSYATTCLESRWNISTSLVIRLMETLSDSQEEVLTSKIKYLVRDFWADNRWKLTMIASLYWTYSLIASIHIIWCHEPDTCH